MFLQIDPYVYKQFSAPEIRLLNAVVHIITSNYPDTDENKVIEKTLELYKEGMHARALQIHVQASLNLKD